MLVILTNNIIHKNSYELYYVLGTGLRICIYLLNILNNCMRGKHSQSILHISRGSESID